MVRSFVFNFQAVKSMYTFFIITSKETDSKDDDRHKKYKPL